MNKYCRLLLSLCFIWSVNVAWAGPESESESGGVSEAGAKQWVDISTLDKVEVGSWGELRSGLYSSNKAIVLTGDITSGTNSPISTVTGKGMVIDGNGFTITGKEGTSNGQFIKFDSSDQTDLIIQNVKLENFGNVQNSGRSYGGAIYNNGTIGNISGDFSGNYVKSTDGYASGGWIYNAEKIGDISGSFIGNFAQSENTSASGGAINNQNGEIGNISGIFNGNHVKGAAEVYGGAIYNSGSTIGDINGSFINNYVDFEIAVAKGLKQGNPEALIGTSATSCLREDRIKNLDRFLTLAGNRFRYDCFFIHTYREAPEYPDLDSDFQRLFEMLAHHGYQKEPIFCSEGMHWKPYKMTNLIPVSWIATPWGPFSYDMGNQERLASAWRARHWLIGLKYHGRIKVMNSSTNFWGFEMDPALTPFATQKISNTLGRLLGNATFRKEIRFSPKTRCYLFEDEQKRPVSALWSCDPDIDNGRKSAPELLLKELPQCSLFDLMEEETTLQKGKNLTLKLSPFPVFLRGQPGSEQDLLTVLQNSALKTPGELAIASSFRLLSPSSGAFLFDNGTRSTFSAIIKIKGRKVPVELASGQKKTVPLELPLILTADKLSFEDFSIPVQQTRPYPDTIRLRENFFGILAKHIQSPIRIDGSLEDWKGIPAIPITGRMSRTWPATRPRPS